MYAKIKKWYEQGLWNEKQVNDAYKKNIITEGQMNEILGKGDL